MKLTVKQALQHGIKAQKAGKSQEAERLYRAILKTQPKHPDANHNLGVLSVQFNQLAGSLPYFKAALEALLNRTEREFGGRGRNFRHIFTAVFSGLQR